MTSNSCITSLFGFISILISLATQLAGYYCDATALFGSVTTITQYTVLEISMIWRFMRNLHVVLISHRISHRTKPSNPGNIRLVTVITLGLLSLFVRE